MPVSDGPFDTYQDPHVRSVETSHPTRSEIRMRTVLTLMAAAALVASTSLVMAQSVQDHAAHHADGASAPASAPKKAPSKAKAAAAKPKAAVPASSASGAMGMGMGSGDNMQQMHDEMHKPGGMHDQLPAPFR